MLSLSKLFRSIVAVALTVVGLSGLSSCSAVYDDLDECPRGVQMRFVFDYNLEFANAFPRQVDCLTVYVFDSEGKLVERRVETTEVLADEGWRMTFDLPAGQYRAVAYGGLECEEASFAHTNSDIRTLEDLEVKINADHVADDEASRPARPLHDLYHGAQDFTVTEGLTYDKTTVEMMRDTNHINLVLQHIDNTPVNPDDFRFEIVDDNTLFNHANEVKPCGTVTYTPWATGTRTTGTDGRAAGDDVQVAYAELSTSRLMYRSQHTWLDSDGKNNVGPRLKITNVNNGKTVVDIPMNNYLLLLKSDKLGKMPNQEFLDRVANYGLVFFLDQNNSWVRVNIVVENWTVRIDNITL